jgi:hypothetical protein
MTKTTSNIGLDIFPSKNERRARRFLGPAKYRYECPRLPTLPFPKVRIPMVVLLEGKNLQRTLQSYKYEIANAHSGGNDSLGSFSSPVDGSDKICLLAQGKRQKDNPCGRHSRKPSLLSSAHKGK